MSIIMPKETDVNPKAIAGRKKAPLADIPFGIMLDVGRVFKLGSDKYGRYNWRYMPILLSDYVSAIQRHFIEWYHEGKDADDESGVHPLAHIIATCMILIDAWRHNSLIDDRFGTKTFGDHHVNPDKMSHYVMFMDRQAALAAKADTKTLMEVINPEGKTQEVKGKKNARRRTSR